MSRGVKLKSLFMRILIPLMLFVVIEISAIAILFYAGGIMRQLKDNSMELLKQNVDGRTKNFQTELTRWSNLKSVVDSLNAGTEGFAAEKGLDLDAIETWTSAEKDELILRAVPEALKAIKYNYVNGIFMVLSNSDYTARSKKSGLYMMCENPELYRNENISIYVASRSVTRALKNQGYSGASIKETYLEFDYSDRFGREEIDYFQKPMGIDESASGAIEENLSTYGYWDNNVNLLPESEPAVTYTVPLSAGGKIYGVFGIALEQTTLTKMLPYYELPGDLKAGIYILGMQTESGFEALYHTGPDYVYLFGESSEIRLDPYNNIYRAPSTRVDDRAYAAMGKLSLYGSDSVFAEEDWVVIGLAREKDLFGFANRMSLWLILIIMLLALLGVGVAILAAVNVSRPVDKLRKQVEAASGRTQIKLENVGIAEVDELVEAFNDLSGEVISSELKLTHLLEASRLPLGAFEYDTVKRTYWCTENFYGIIGVDKPSDNDFDVFMRIVDKISSLKAEGDQEQTYKITDRNGIVRYVMFKSFVYGNKTIGIVQDVTEEALEKNKIKYERDFDLLTDVYNRRAFNTKLQQFFSDKDALKIAAFMMLDLDNLKGVNDNFGHEIGDEYIRTTAHILRGFASPQVLVGRLSGDEFGIFAHGFDSEAEIKTLFETMEKSIKQRSIYASGEESIKLCCSGGIAYYPRQSENMDELKRYADFAMYEMKHTTKGSLGVFDTGSYDQRAYLIRDNVLLNRIIEQNLVEYRFQPIVRVASGRIYAYEALMRSTLPELENPAAIVALARAQSKLHQIELLTWRNALRCASKYADVFETRMLFVNSIPNQIVSDNEIAELEATYPKLLRQIVLEFTEDEKLMPEITEKKRELIRRWGGLIALDDFGTGYNGDTVLLILNPNLIKVDMYIVRDIDNDPSKRTLLSALVTYAHSRGIRVIAEGVETKGELEAVIKCGVNYIQGFYVGRPSKAPGEIDKAKAAEVSALYRKYQIK